MKKSNHDRLRDNMSRAKSGGPDYRATDTGKGDVNRSRNKNKMDLGFDLIEIAKQYGHDSPQYAAVLKEWRRAQG